MFVLAAAASGGAGASAADKSARFDMYAAEKDVRFPVEELGTRDFTISMFVSGSGSLIRGVIASKERRGESTDFFRIEAVKGNKVAVFGLGLEAGDPAASNEYGWSSALTSKKPLEENKITHVAFSRYRAKCTLLIDGKPDAEAWTESADGKRGLVKHENGADLRIGSRLCGGYGPEGGENYFGGYIAGAQFFPRALSFVEAARLSDGEDLRSYMPARHSQDRLSTALPLMNRASFLTQTHWLPAAHCSLSHCHPLLGAIHVQWPATRKCCHNHPITGPLPSKWFTARQPPSLWFSCRRGNAKGGKLPRSICF